MLDEVAQNQLQLLFALGDNLIKELLSIVWDLWAHLEHVLLECGTALVTRYLNLEVVSEDTRVLFDYRFEVGDLA